MTLQAIEKDLIAKFGTKLASPHAELKGLLADCAVVFRPVAVRLFIGCVGLHALATFNSTTAVADLWLAFSSVVVKECKPTKPLVADRTGKCLGVRGGLERIVREKRTSAGITAQILLVNPPLECFKFISPSLLLSYILIIFQERQQKHS